MAVASKVTRIIKYFGFNCEVERSERTCEVSVVSLNDRSRYGQRPTAVVEEDKGGGGVVLVVTT